MSYIIKPLISLNEILNWKKKKHNDDCDEFSIKLNNNLIWQRNNVLNNDKEVKNLREINMQKLIHCHDMLGGYKYDNNAYGRHGNDLNIFNESYNFAYWHLIDIFIYFSHSLLTIPPHQWINCAHKNGVLVLGTFIVEWEAGTKILNELLNSKDLIDKVINQMIDIATYYKFDGWFINIESKLSQPCKQLPMMLYFVEKLTNDMHNKQPESMVIWYDSLTCDGLIHWQNKLNEKNKLFFDICDGIFTNYTWNEHDPKLSNTTAGDKRKYDVYTGIDIWGRGSYGGGGFNGLMKALDVIKNTNTSIALFAPAWTFEHCAKCGECGRLEYERIESTLWDSNIHHHNHSKSIRSFVEPKYLSLNLPFIHNFNTGVGKCTYKNGIIISEQEWYLQSKQDLTFSFNVYNKETLEKLVLLDYYNISFCYDCAWNGGSCLQIISQQHNNNNSNYFIELFHFTDKKTEEKDDNDSQLNLSITVKPLIDQPLNSFSIIITNYQNNNIIELKIVSTSMNNDWQQFEHIISSKLSIKSIGFIIDGAIHIGQLSICKQQQY